MAAWLIENQYENAIKVAEEKYPFDNGKTCPFFDASGHYHCSIYGGRPFICRLFGASCSGGKDGTRTWRPCRFYTDELLAARKPPIERKQYSESDAKSIFPVLPPVMSDVMEQALSVSPDSVESRPSFFLMHRARLVAAVLPITRQSTIRCLSRKTKQML